MSKVFKKVMRWAQRRPLIYKSEITEGKMNYSAFDKLPDGKIKKILKYYKVPEEISEEFIKRDFNTISRMSHIISQLKHESANFTRMEENLNYSVSRLLEVFRTRVTREQATKLARRPREIANHVYGGRYGNVLPNDGYDYRGRGPLMITFKDSYREAENDLKIPFVTQPELMSNMKEGMIATLNWLHKRRITRIIDKAPTNYDAVKSLTKAINGGYNGLNHRESLFHQTLKEIRGIVK